jgi:hypothetical protein
MVCELQFAFIVAIVVGDELVGGVLLLPSDRDLIRKCGCVFRCFGLTAFSEKKARKKSLKEYW